MKIGESIVLNLAARYAAAFGIVAVSNKINQAIVNRDENKYSVDIYEDFDEAFEQVIFSYNTEEKKTELNFATMLHGDGNGSVYAPPLMINFSREKNLIETEVSGGDNVVIERWGTKPWDIDIKGVLIDVENRKYPTEKIEELCKFFEFNNIIRVDGQQFFEKNIDSIYLKSISITPVEGFQDTMQFSLSARSVKEVTYTLLKPNE